VLADKTAGNHRQLTVKLFPGRALAAVAALVAALLLSGLAGYVLRAETTVSTTSSTRTSASSTAADSGNAPSVYEGSTPAVTGGDPAVAEPGSQAR
jgi:hypothetical protein